MKLRVNIEICFPWVLCVIRCSSAMRLFVSLKSCLIFLPLLLLSNLPLHFCHSFTLFHSHRTLSTFQIENLHSKSVHLLQRFFDCLSHLVSLVELFNIIRTRVHTFDLVNVTLDICISRFLYVYIYIYIYEIHSKHFCWLYREKCVLLKIN